MAKTRRLLREEITYSFAKQRRGYYDQQIRFFDFLNSQKDSIRSIVAHHLNLRSPNTCHVAEVEDWLYGSFNVCIPVTIVDWKGKKQPGDRVLLRIPLPYRVGEAFRPGNSDEKVRCEAGTYAWLQENCPDIPIPKLYGFSVSAGVFSQIDNLPFLMRCLYRVRRCLRSLFGYPTPSHYVGHRGGPELLNDEKERSNFLLNEYIEEDKGRMLSKSWLKKRDDPTLRMNLFRDLSRIFLSLARHPVPKIGSVTIDNSGFLRFENRPLPLGIQELENEEIPIDIPRDYTYSTVDSYIVDILGLHDSRFRHQPNAINNYKSWIRKTGKDEMLQGICVDRIRTINHTASSAKEILHQIRP
ncbi:predicted protein [Uncinocarpus reesii 1704]|uniref:Aminoglycoside phosphotransferase domain-containing protein n=1 Tax=Uncinocarpus reesii (strain UAMH 1704) TaxID=336963 RepID=C4JU48_UNCRE|nr:uncharacterized protein UREG_05987 [Uncinocarpus reesii 1704]EEP81145.1 predicted protein [Uncinocarpus reesii 1704]